MYESDEWYVQYDLDKDPRARMKFNAKVRHDQTIADTEDHWDLDSSASDNESYEIETES